MFKMVCIVLVGGIPGSGKSTLIDSLVKNNLFAVSDLHGNAVSFNHEIQMLSVNSVSTSKKCFTLVPISYDELSTIPEQQKLIDVPNGWKDFRKDFLDAVEHYICFLCQDKHEFPEISSRTKMIFDYLINKYSSHNGLGNQVILLVEDNFYFSSMRYKWFQVCRKYELGFCQVFLNCSVDAAIKRNNARMNKVSEDVIQTMSGKLELPDSQKNSWEKFSFIHDTVEEHGTFPVKEIFQLIINATENPPESIVDITEQKREAQIICSQNVVHQADRILRRLTGQVVKQLLTRNRSSEELKILTSKISQSRQKLLRELSEGTVCLPLNITEAIRNHEIEGQAVEAEKHLCVLLENKIDEMLQI